MPQSGNNDVLNADELSLKVWLTVLQEHCDDFAKIDVEFIQRFSLRVGARETGDVPDIQTSIGASFYNRLVGLHYSLSLHENEYTENSATLRSLPSSGVVASFDATPKFSCSIAISQVPTWRAMYVMDQ